MAGNESASRDGRNGSQWKTWVILERIVGSCRGERNGGLSFADVKPGRLGL